MNAFEKVFQHPKVVFLDLDGTVYLGGNLLPGAREFLLFLDEKNINYYFLSNNSSSSKQDYVRKISRLGISVTTEKIILSTDGVIEFLREQQRPESFVIGTESMREMFAAAGLIVESQNPEYVVLGYDTELNYDKLSKGALYLQQGADLLATHPDLVCPTPAGPIPDVGAMLALFEKATGIKPARIFGKPNPEMISHVLERHQSEPEAAVMIGDRLYTDMELARRTGCGSLLVLSGETQPEDLKNSRWQPDLVAKNLGSVLS